MEKIMAPEIRFQSFDQQWEESTFSDNFEMLKNNSLSRDFLNNVGGMLQDVHYGDILIKYDEVLNAKCDTIPYITDDEISAKYKNNLLKDGDIIIADTAEDSTTGKCVEIRNIGNSSIVSGLHTIPCRPKHVFSEGYLGYYLNSDAFHSQLLPIMQGTKVVSISKSSIVDIPVRYPNDAKEQAKIGDIFNYFVELLKSKREELVKMENIKNAYMDKMFPREGESTPKLRFKGFTDDWKEDILLNNMEVINSKPYLAENETNGKYIIVQQGDNPISGYSNKTPYEYYNSVVLFGDHTMSFYKPVDRFLISSDGVKILKSSIESWFFYYLLLKYSPQPEGYKRHLSILKEITINIPSFAEQEKIGNFFRHMDKLIAAKRQEVEKLQNLKQSLLNKMFVNA